MACHDTVLGIICWSFFSLIFFFFSDLFTALECLLFIHRHIFSLSLSLSLSKFLIDGCRETKKEDGWKQAFKGKLQETLFRVSPT
jgi:hypothetical protein